VDLALLFDDAVAKVGARVREVGDLSDAVAIDTLQAEGLYLHVDPASLTRTGLAGMLTVGAPVTLFIRRGASANSALVQTITGAAASDGR
jgi:hypothetical protein